MLKKKGFDEIRKENTQNLMCWSGYKQVGGMKDKGGKKVLIVCLKICQLKMQ